MLNDKVSKATIERGQAVLDAMGVGVTLSSEEIESVESARVRVAWLETELGRARLALYYLEFPHVCPACGGKGRVCVGETAIVYDCYIVELGEDGQPTGSHWNRCGQCSGKGRVAEVAP
jgi:hypothetical protein